MSAMVRGFASNKDRHVESIEGLEQALNALDRKPGTIWLDLEAPDDETLNAVGAALQLDPEALEDCLSGDQRPRIDEFHNCLFIVTYGVLEPESASKFDARKVSAFVGRNFLVTVQAEPLESVSNVFSRVSRTPERMLERGTNFILYSIIDGLVDNYIRVAEGFDDRLDILEEESFSDDVDDTLLHRTSQLRRDVLELRRIATSQRELVAPIARGEYDLISESLEADFRHVLDHVTKTIELIDNLRELLHGVRDNYQAMQGNRMNAIMKTLTIFASLFLPLTLIAGIYGMNTPLWPDPGSAATFWGIIAIMGAAIVAMVGFFYHRGWL